MNHNAVPASGNNVTSEPSATRVITPAGIARQYSPLAVAVVGRVTVSTFSFTVNEQLIMLPSGSITTIWFSLSALYVPAITSLNSIIISLSSVSSLSAGMYAFTTIGSRGISRSVSLIVEPASAAPQWLIPPVCAFMYWPAVALSMQKPSFVAVECITMNAVPSATSAIVTLPLPVDLMAPPARFTILKPVQRSPTKPHV